MDWIDASPLVLQNIEQALDYIWEKMPQAAREEFCAASVDDLWQFHHGLGRAIRNELGLWEDDPPSLRSYFEQQLGLEQPDDMSHVLIRALHAQKAGSYYDMAADVKAIKETYAQYEQGTKGGTQE